MTPRDNSQLLGQDSTEQSLLAAIQAGRLPHALIFSGEAGIGKATLAYRLARYLLTPAALRKPDTLATDMASPTARQIIAHAHPDLITVERQQEETSGKLHKEIAVEDVRKIAPFLHTTASEGGWRVAIIDEASTMNRAGQNALLKILEEPPARSLIILIAERPGALLPTIHSRCRMMRLPVLNLAVLETLLEKYHPEISASDRAAAARLAGGSIGKALRLIDDDGIALYGEMVSLLGPLPNFDWHDVHRFGERLGTPVAESAYRLFGEFLPAWIARLAKSSIDGQAVEIVADETRLYERLLALRPLDHWLGACDKIIQRLAVTDSANLDRKLVVWAAFETLAEAAA